MFILIFGHIEEVDISACDIAALAEPENPSRYNKVQPYAVDEDSAQRLWAMSEEMVAGV